jgi:hypothetical protein
MCFFHQSEDWWKKQFLQSARRPEIRENFRPAQFSHRVQKPHSGFCAPGYQPDTAA